MHSTAALAIALLPSLVAAWLPHFLAKPARVVEFNDRFVMKDGNSPYDDEFIARYAVDEGGNTILVELPLVATEKIGYYPPTKTTKEGNLNPRSSFTFICPTSVQCNDGGCCAIGDYCAIRDGTLGCCPIGSLCDASPIPGCSVYSQSLSSVLTVSSCYGICCDIIQDIIGENVCSPTTGDGGQASGVCTGVEPTSPLFTPPSVNCLALTEL